ncbi:MAG: mechanosensitive ion channel [Pirellulaceae bacterium]
MKLSLLLMVKFAIIAVALLADGSVQFSHAQEDPELVDQIRGEQVDERLKQIDENVQLSDEEKQAAKDTLQQAKSELEQISTWQASAKKFKDSAKTLDSDLKSVKQSLGDLPETHQQTPADTASLQNLELQDLEVRLSEAEAALNTKAEARNKWEAEPKRRAARLTTIQETLSAYEKELGEIQTELAGTPADETLTSQTRRMWLRARSQLLTAAIDSLKVEREYLELPQSRELIEANRTLAQREFAIAESEAKPLRIIVDQRRSADARYQLRQAEAAAEKAPPELEDLAKYVSVLANERVDLSNDLASTRQKVATETEKLDGLRTEFDRAQRRVDAVGLSQQSGQLLRQQRALLPDSRAYRRRIRERQVDLGEANFQLYEYQDQQWDLSDLQDELTAFSSNQQEAAKRLLTNQRQIIDDLANDAEKYMTELLKLDDIENDVVTTTEEYKDFIDQRVLWIRSGFTLHLRDLATAADAFQWLLAAPNWQQLADELLRDVRKNPLFIGLSVLAFSCLLYLQKPMRRTITSIGEMVIRRGFSRFLPTIRVFVLTLIISLFWPAVFAVFAWRISSTLSASDFVRCVAAGLGAVAYAWFPLEFLRQSCRHFGLAESHFDWPRPLLRTVRRQLAALLVIGLPLLFLSEVLHADTANPMRANSLGRISFILIMLLTSYILDRILRSSNGVAQQVLIHAHNRWLVRLRYVIVLLLAATPLVLAGLAAIGFLETTQTLAKSIFETGCLFVGMQMLRATVNRWVLMRRRRLAFEQAVQRRAAIAATSSAEGAPLVTEADEIDVSGVSQQTSKILGTLIVVVALFVLLSVIWVDVIPALNYLKEVPVPGLSSISVASALLAVAILAVTYVAATNVPGLLELSLLQYLPVDAGARYATTTLCRYSIAILGITLAGNALEITWASIQWLVAAMGIGLGFGLQEIFANFISGLILLFERPIRVGDIITLGDTTGTVTKIRMRATTITDWDRKEFVVPNKDLVTGRLLNWTLTDPINRIVIKVGVAYGTNTRQALDTLLEVAKTHP